MPYNFFPNPIPSGYIFGPGYGCCLTQTLVPFRTIDYTSTGTFYLPPATSYRFSGNDGTGSTITGQALGTETLDIATKDLYTKAELGFGTPVLVLAGSPNLTVELFS